MIMGNFCRKCESISLECLEEARKSFGIDEDLILVIFPIFESKILPYVALHQNSYLWLD